MSQLTGRRTCACAWNDVSWSFVAVVPGCPHLASYKWGNSPSSNFATSTLIWVWVNTYRYIFNGMNIHLPAILGFTRYQGFDPSPYVTIFWLCCLAKTPAGPSSTEAPRILQLPEIKTFIRKFQSSLQVQRWELRNGMILLIFAICRLFIYTHSKIE